MVATLKGPGHLRLGHDLQPLDESWHGSSGVPRHRRSARTAWRWFPVHSGLDGALSQTGTGTKFFPSLSPTALLPARQMLKHQGPPKPVFSQMNHHLFSLHHCLHANSIPLKLLTANDWLLTAIKGIITKVWMTYASATFKGCLLIQISLRVLKWIQEVGLYGLGGLLGFSTIPGNSSPQNSSVKLIIAIPPLSLVSFDCSSTPHKTELNTQTSLGGAWRPHQNDPIRSHENIREHYFSSKCQRMFLCYSSATIVYL